MTGDDFYQAKDGTRLMPLAEPETRELIRVSNGRTVPLRFGIGNVALVADAAPWAVQIVLARRTPPCTTGGSNE